MPRHWRVSGLASVLSVVACSSSSGSLPGEGMTSSIGGQASAAGSVSAGNASAAGQAAAAGAGSGGQVANGGAAQVTEAGANSTPRGGANSTPSMGGTQTGGMTQVAAGSGGEDTGMGGASGGNAGTGGGDENTATQAAAAMGRGVNLGQMFESTQHPRTLEAARAKIDAYYERGFRNLRIPITWTEPVGGDLLVDDATVGSVNRSHPRLQIIEAVVDYALTKPDLYVVINAHHEATLKTQSRGSVLERLWMDIADIFRARDPRLLFEILNEPHRSDGSAMPAQDLRAMTGLAYDQIRSVDPTRIVLFGGNQWFGAHEIPSVWTSIEEVGGGADPYVMATFHHYDPWTFCGDNQGTYDDAWTDDNQAGPMDTMATWASTVGGGMPVYIGEWGVGWGSRYSRLTCNNIRQWYTSFDSVHASGHGQPTAVWDDGGWFKIFDHSTNSYGNNLIDCILGSCQWDGDQRFNDGCL